MLIASRPIAIKALKQSVPDNFTVMTAARGDQTAKPLKEAKHGMFSYFLMKGMEGEADQNRDNKITAGELLLLRPKRSPAGLLAPKHLNYKVMLSVF